MKLKKLEELNLRFKVLTSNQQQKIKGGIGNDDLDIMIKDEKPKTIIVGDVGALLNIVK